MFIKKGKWTIDFLILVIFFSDKNLVNFRKVSFHLAFSLFFFLAHKLWCVPDIKLQQKLESSWVDRSASRRRLLRLIPPGASFMPQTPENLSVCVVFLLNKSDRSQRLRGEKCRMKKRQRQSPKPVVISKSKLGNEKITLIWLIWDVSVKNVYNYC